MPYDDFDMATMPLGDHLDELRKRLLLALLGLLPVLIVGMALGRRMLEWLLIPVRESLRQEDLVAQLQTISPAEAFYTYVKIALVFTVLVGSPWILYQLWRFIAPGLYASERRFAYLLAPMSMVLSITSVLFVFFVILPVVLTFFIQFGSSIGDQDPGIVERPPSLVLPTIPVLEGDPADLAPGEVWLNLRLKQIRVASGEPGEIHVLGSMLTGGSVVAQQYRLSEYVRMVLVMMLGFAVAFQLPVVVLLLGWAGIVTPKFLGKYRRHALLVLAIISAVLTPADPLSMILMAVPLYLLYELGILLLGVLKPGRVAGGFSDEDYGSAASDEEQRP